jgi:hypothetical protein
MMGSTHRRQVRTGGINNIATHRSSQLTEAPPFLKGGYRAHPVHTGTRVRDAAKRATLEFPYRERRSRSDHRGPDAPQRHDRVDEPSGVASTPLRGRPGGGGGSRNLLPCAYGAQRNQRRAVVYASKVGSATRNIGAIRNGAHGKHLLRHTNVLGIWRRRPDLNRDGGFADLTGMSIVLSRAGLWSVQYAGFAWCLGSVGLQMDYRMHGFRNALTALLAVLRFPG